VFNAIRVVHLFMEDRPGQTRGISQFATGAVGLFDMNDAVWAELTALRMQAYAGLHFKPDAAESAVLEDLGATEIAQEAPADPVKEIAMEAGQVIDYAGEVKLLSSNRPGGSFLPFVSKLVADWAVSVGIPTWVVEGDYSKANYSSMRAAEVTCRPTFEEIQNILIDVQARPDVTSWLQFAVLTGRVKLRSGQTVESIMRDVEWQKPGFPYVDPLKESQADALLIGLGLKTFDQACAERGLHGRDQRWRIKRSQELDAEAGVTTPTVGHGSPVESTGPNVDQEDDSAPAMSPEEQA
jgi:capsid protein